MNTLSLSHTVERRSLSEILRRAAFPFFLFAAALFGLLLLSWTLLVPELTHIEVGGQKRSVSDLEEYEHDLRAQISALEKDRNGELFADDDTLYVQLLQMKEQRLRLQDIRREVSRIAQGIVPDAKNIVAFSMFTYDADSETAEIRGDVHNVGPRSMTVLAEFVDALRTIPFVTSVESSRFTRVEDGDGNFSSPFIIRLTLLQQ